LTLYPNTHQGSTTSSVSDEVSGTRYRIARIVMRELRRTATTLRGLAGDLGLAPSARQRARRRCARPHTHRTYSILSTPNILA
jgi:hypothetical protein